jgi:hypothetical protein
VINYELDGHIQAEKDKLTLEEAKKEFEKSLPVGINPIHNLK